MSLPVQKLIISTILLILVFASGIWLRKLSTPYPVFLTTIHKLLSLAMFVFLVWASVIVWKNIPLNTTTQKMLLISSTLFILTLASGTLTTSEKTLSTPVQIAHRMGALLFLLSLVSSGVFVFLCIQKG